MTSRRTAPHPRKKTVGSIDHVNTSIPPHPNPQVRQNAVKTPGDLCSRKQPPPRFLGFLLLITYSNNTSMSETFDTKTCEQPAPMGAIDVQTVCFPPYPFMINHSCQLQQLSKQHGNIQICGFIPTLHVDVRRPDSGRWWIPKQPGPFSLVGKAMSKWEVGGFHGRVPGVFWCFKISFVKSHVQQKGFRIMSLQELKKNAKCSCRP